MNKEEYKEFFPSIDTDNPWEYYGTDNIEDIPRHLRKEALKFKNRNI